MNPAIDKVNVYLHPASIDPFGRLLLYKVDENVHNPALRAAGANLFKGSTPEIQAMQSEDIAMKRFEELFVELKAKAQSKDPQSGTVKALNKGKHFIGKKVIEEAGEVWIAAEYEGREKTAEEISQLLYHLQVMMISCDLELEDVYKYL
mgnify:CR=1 FL=1